VTLLARFEQAGDAAERRGSERRGLKLAITASVPESPELAVAIHDLSETGLLLETPIPLASGQTFQAFLPLAGAVEATVVWSSHQFHGCEFAQRVPRAAVSAALLKSDGAGAEAKPLGGTGDVLSQLRDVSARIEQIGEDLDRTISELSASRAGGRAMDRDAVIAAALPQSPIISAPPAEPVTNGEHQRFYEPLESPVEDAARPVVIISLVLAALAALILLAALLDFPLRL
jgi:hypothetical protein